MNEQDEEIHKHIEYINGHPFEVFDTLEDALKESRKAVEAINRFEYMKVRAQELSQAIEDGEEVELTKDEVIFVAFYYEDANFSATNQGDLALAKRLKEKADWFGAQYDILKDDGHLTVRFDKENLIIKLGKYVPLFRAVKSGNAAEVKRLIEQGVDVNVKDGYGCTALMNTISLVDETLTIDEMLKDHPEIVKLLIDAGADVNAQDIHQTTALIYASREGHTEIVNLLIEAGAKEY